MCLNFVHFVREVRWLFRGAILVALGLCMHVSSGRAGWDTRYAEGGFGREGRCTARCTGLGRCSAEGGMTGETNTRKKQDEGGIR
jgi:hypothetical protein